MASSTAGFEPMLANSMRVMRNLTALEDLITAWPILEQKSSCSPPTLTDAERRIFLDLPDHDLETKNIRALTGLSR
ncbi:hypothetical protein ONS95_004580 [Cadophora gregata]|uniref:uncharacterized protein n=1 Tax=Cadophora gregata TaxID=51156 RepID=UPI0026DA7346|nr:uncharacterized protein ONS95_004580 [Cadophora gregata]KAK0105054.1 hypothetical protein ONS96_004457 [Cadophora gregata f. sp. sojae]KAK0106075.1 hypothetical protein ONS95_004580 [Cadophora gregata]